VEAVHPANQVNHSAPVPHIHETRGEQGGLDGQDVHNIQGLPSDQAPEVNPGGFVDADLYWDAQAGMPGPG
jgi:hypothetical protein